MDNLTKEKLEKTKKVIYNNIQTQEKIGKNG